MKARIPLMILEAEDYRDAVAYNSLFDGSTVLNMCVSFPQLSLYNYNIPVEATQLDCDIDTMLKIKHEQMNKLAQEIEVLKRELTKTNKHQ